MNEKEVMNAYFYSYLGIWLFLFFIYLESTGYNDFYFSIERTLSFIIGTSLFSIILITVGLWKLKQNEITIRINKKTIKNIKLILMIVSFALICIGIGFSSFFKPVIINTDNNFGGLSWLAWHPFGIQGLVLFWMGTGIQLFEWVWYYDSVSSKIMKETKQG